MSDSDSQTRKVATIATAIGFVPGALMSVGSLFTMAVISMDEETFEKNDWMMPILIAGLFSICIVPPLIGVASGLVYCVGSTLWGAGKRVVGKSSNSSHDSPHVPNSGKEQLEDVSIESDTHEIATTSSSAS